MLANTLWESFVDHRVTLVMPMVLLALLIQLLVPRIMKAEKAAEGFWLGIVVFAAYTLILLLMIWFLCYDASAIADCLVRACVAVMLVNVMMLFAAVLFYVSRDKRSMTQEERMRLKDL